MKTALVVDESPRWRGMVAEALREQGWAVTTAAALPDAEAGGHDLAVLEWAPDPASETGLWMYLNAPTSRPTQSVLLIPRPLGEGGLALRQHPSVLGVLDKSHWSSAAILALTRRPTRRPPRRKSPPRLGSHRPQVLVVEDAAWRAIYRTAGRDGLCALLRRQLRRGRAAGCQHGTSEAGDCGI
jgi:hypothetical protein